MTTKEQERKALAQIKKIVESLGENSYVAMALEGCFEIAEQNIENDFGCSMKQRAEGAEKKAAELQDQIYRLENAFNAAKRKNEQSENIVQHYKGQVKDLGDKIDELRDALIEANNRAACENEELEIADAKIKELQDEIIRLKAKLYDLMTA